MSGDALKKRVRRNKEVIQFLFVLIAGTNAVAGLLGWLVRGKVVTLLNILTLAVEAGVYYVLKKISTPVTAHGEKKTEIKDGGADLHSRGVVHILKEVVYISLAAKVAGMVWRKSWIIFALVPITGYYEIFRRRDMSKKR